MATFVEQVCTSVRPLLWLDADDYGRRLLLGGAPLPWHDSGSYLAFVRQLQGLLKSDVLGLDLGRFYREWVAGEPSLATAMGEKRRSTFPLRVMLADERAKERLVELVTGLTGTFPGRPLLLRLPDPTRWLHEAWQSAKKGPPPEIDVETAGNAAMYIADCLRTLAALPVAGILVESSTGRAIDPAPCQPIINLARHYRWSIGAASCDDANNFDFVIADHPHSNRPTGIRHHLGDGLPGASGEAQIFIAIGVDQDAVPEQVLEQLARLRDN